MTHPCVLDYLGNLDEMLLVLGSVLATDEYLDRNSPTLDLVEVFRCSGVSQKARDTTRVYV